MDNEEALRRLEYGAALLCMGVPRATEFGVDLMTWAVSDGFRGVKMVPPGFHYVRYRSVPTSSPTVLSEGEEGAREVRYAPSASPLPLLGFFAFLEPREVLVRRWDVATEELLALEEEEARRFELGVRNRDFDGGLGPYPQEHMEQWKRLSSFITEATLWRCEPPHNRSARAAFLHCTPDAQAQSCEGQGERSASNEFRFTAVPEKWAPAGCKAGAERTHYAMDKTALVRHLAAGELQGSLEELLAELQLSFIAFWLAEDYEGFEQWKRLVRLLCSCEELAADRPLFVAKFLTVLSAQLEIAPGDFFVDPLSKNNFLLSALRDLFEILLTDPSVSQQLQELATALREHVTERFGGHFGGHGGLGWEDEDEDAPVVVYI
jgi:A1 cistron-splicing factor AAR2